MSDNNISFPKEKTDNIAIFGEKKKHMVQGFVIRFVVRVGCQVKQNKTTFKKGIFIYLFIKYL